MLVRLLPTARPVQAAGSWPMQERLGLQEEKAQFVASSSAAADLTLVVLQTVESLYMQVFSVGVNVFIN